LVALFSEGSPLELLELPEPDAANAGIALRVKINGAA
jgi:hypothetical protein